MGETQTAAAPAAEPDRKVKGMRLLFTLSKDDVDVRTRELVGAVKERQEKAASLDREKEASKGKLKTLEAELAGLDGRVNELAHVVRTGQEERVVDVYDVPDGEKYAVNTVRVDTGEIVATRGMTDTERELDRKRREAEKQRSMFSLTDPKPIPADEPDAGPRKDKGRREAGAGA